MGVCAALGSPCWTQTLVTRGHTYGIDPKNPGFPVITGGYEYRTTSRVYFWDSDAYDWLTI